MSFCPYVQCLLRNKIIEINLRIFVNFFQVEVRIFVTFSPSTFNSSLYLCLILSLSFPLSLSHTLFPSLSLSPSFALSLSHPGSISSTFHSQLLVAQIPNVQKRLSSQQYCFTLFGPKKCKCCMLNVGEIDPLSHLSFMSPLCLKLSIYKTIYCQIFLIPVTLFSFYLSSFSPDFLPIFQHSLNTISHSPLYCRFFSTVGHFESWKKKLQEISSNGNSQ